MGRERSFVPRFRYGGSPSPAMAVIKAWEMVSRLRGNDLDGGEKGG